MGCGAESSARTRESLGRNVTLRAASALGPRRPVGDSFTVIGVMPNNFRVPIFDANLWIPLVLSPAELTRQEGTPV
jgi:hypothetical protein